MATGDIRFVVVVDDKGTPSIRAVDKALDDLGQTADKKAAGGFGKLWQQMALGQMAWSAAQKAIGAVKDVIGEAVKAGMEQEKVERSLVTALELTGRTVEGNKQHYLNFAAQQMKYTTYTDDEIEATQTLLIQMTRLNQDGIDKATKGAMGLATTLGIDLQSATMRVTKAMDGNYEALGKVNIKVSEGLSPQEKQNELLEKLGVLYGRTTADADTFGGRLMQLKNSWGEMLETAGTAIITNKSVQDGMATLKEQIDKLAQSSDFKLWLSIVVDGLVKAAEAAGKFAGGCKNLMENVFGAKKADDEFADSQEKLNKAIERARDDGHDLGGKVKEFIGPIQDLNKGVVETGNQAVITSDKIKIVDGTLGNTSKSIQRQTLDLGLWKSGITDVLPEGAKLVDNNKLVERMNIDMSLAMAAATVRMDDQGEAASTDAKLLEYLAGKAGVTTSEFFALYYQCQQLRLELLSMSLAWSGMMGAGFGLPTIDWSKITNPAKQAAKDTTDYFAGFYNDVARGFGDTVKNWAAGATTFKDFISGIWGNIKDAFFNMIGEMVTGWTMNFLKSIISGTSGAFSEISKGASSLVSGVSGILSGGLAAGIGSFAGTFLAGILGGGPSGHAQGQAINDAKDSRNFLADIKNWLFSAGSGFGGAVWDYSQKFTNEKIDELKGFVARLGDEQIGPRIDTSNAWLRDIEGNTRALRNITEAQHGWSGTVSRPTLFVAGERGPEHVTVTPNINIRPSQTVISLDGRALAMAITPYLTRLEQDGIKKSGY